MGKGSDRSAVSTQEAKEQAAEYFGFAASVYVRGKSGEVWEIPNPGLLDDDQQERWEELQFLLEDCDRKPDIEVPERTLDDGTVIPARTIPGDLKTPYRINGELLKPSYNVRLAMALFGDEYEDFKADGGSGNQVALEWARMNREYMERVEADSKSDGGASSVEAVS